MIVNTIVEKGGPNVQIFVMQSLLDSEKKSNRKRKSKRVEKGVYRKGE